MMALRCAFVILGINKPFPVLFRSRMEDASGSAPSVLMATLCEKLIKKQKLVHSKSVIRFMIVRLRKQRFSINGGLRKISKSVEKLSRADVGIRE